MKKIKSIIILSLLFSFLLGASLNTLAGGCLTVYNPVCGIDNKTYSNSCFAALADVDIAYQNKCIIDHTITNTNESVYGEKTEQILNQAEGKVITIFGVDILIDKVMKKVNKINNIDYID